MNSKLYFSASLNATIPKFIVQTSNDRMAFKFSLHIINQCFALAQNSLTQSLNEVVKHLLLIFYIFFRSSRCFNKGQLFWQNVISLPLTIFDL